MFSKEDMEEKMSVTNVTEPNDGRNRRKVMFRSDDMNFSDLNESDTQDNDDDDDDDDIDDYNDIEKIAPVSEENNDSEWSDSDDETEIKNNETDKSRFYGRSFGKESEIRKKIANELEKLDKINRESNINNWNEQEQDYSDDENMEYDEDSDVNDSGDEKNLKTDESDENDDLSEVDESDEDAETHLAGKASKDCLQETNEHSTLNWKTNLAQKAANAYYDRQNSVANLWKLVYGSYNFVYSLCN